MKVLGRVGADVNAAIHALAPKEATAVRRQAVPGQHEDASTEASTQPTVRPAVVEDNTLAAAAVAAVAAAPAAGSVLVNAAALQRLKVQVRMWGGCCWLAFERAMNLIWFTHGCNVRGWMVLRSKRHRNGGTGGSVPSAVMVVVNVALTAHTDAYPGATSASRRRSRVGASLGPAPRAEPHWRGA